MIQQVRKQKRKEFHFSLFSKIKQIIDNVFIIEKLIKNSLMMIVSKIVNVNFMKTFRPREKNSSFYI
jgi:hypothetical protein